MASSSPQPSTADADQVVSKPSATIPPEDLPAVSCVALHLQPSTAPLQDDGPVTIHNRSVEEYQGIYSELVEDMLRSVSIKNLHFFIEILVILYRRRMHLNHGSFRCDFCCLGFAQIQERSRSSLHLGAGPSHQAEAVGADEPAHVLNVGRRGRAGARGHVVRDWSLPSPV